MSKSWIQITEGNPRSEIGLLVMAIRIAKLKGARLNGKSKIEKRLQEIINAPEIKV